MDEAVIRVRNLTKSFGGRKAVDDLSWQCQELCANLICRLRPNEVSRQ